jgi:arylsulfatase A-like enzyme
MSSAVSSHSRPNILWLVFDCGRHDRFNVHGNPTIMTPNLDRLAKDGLDYRHAYSAAIWSLPSYTSLLTGLYPRQHGVNAANRRLLPAVLTLPQILHDVGYETACFSNNAWLDPSFGVGKGFGHFHRMWYSAQERLVDRMAFLSDKFWGCLVGRLDKGARRTNRRITKWVHDHSETPWFAFVSYVEPHAPYTRYLRSAPLDQRLQYLRRSQQEIATMEWIRSLPAKHKFADGELEGISRRYDQELEYLDILLGALLGDLQRGGLLRNTILIITADHGEMLGEHDMLGHQFSVHEVLRRVPLIVWSPSYWRNGAEIFDVVQSLDLVRSICQWCGVDGQFPKDIHSLPESNATGVRQYAITDYPDPFLDLVRSKFPKVDLSKLNVGLACVSDGRFKVVVRTDGGSEGYDLADDPQELRPLATDSDHRMVGMQAHLHEHLANAADLPVSDEDVPMEVVEHLRTLGYME